MPGPAVVRVMWFLGILGAVYLAFAVGNYLVGGVSPETVRHQFLVVLGIAWGLAAWRPHNWLP
jgi:hypothetical protein